MKTEMKVPNECLYPTDVFLISCGMGCKRITVTDIAYIEAMKDNCIIDMYYYGHVVLENGMEVHIGDKYRDALKSSFHFWGSRNRNK